MRLTTTIMKSSVRDFVIVKIGEHQPKIVRGVAAAITMINKHDARLATIHGAVVNLLEWHGFSDEEQAQITKKDQS